MLGSDVLFLFIHPHTLETSMPISPYTDKSRYVFHLCARFVRPVRTVWMVQVLDVCLWVSKTSHMAKCHYNIYLSLITSYH